MAAAEEVMKGMQEEGPPPDIFSYNTLISGYAQVATQTPAQTPHPYKFDIRMPIGIPSQPHDKNRLQITVVGSSHCLKVKWQSQGGEGGGGLVSSAMTVIEHNAFWASSAYAGAAHSTSETSRNQQGILRSNNHTAC
jgi:hypothetical protein